MQRRRFLATPLGLAASQLKGASPESRVYANSDGIPHSPEDYARLLASLSSSGKVSADTYSLGGTVEALEAKMAALTGKETAVWLPTGTLANHLAVRLLAGSKRRVLVQAVSHLYNDCGDCCQTLSGLTLVPVAPGKATFTAAEAQQAAKDSMSGRVEAPVGAIQIESPVRRRSGEHFDFEEMQKISAWARGNGIGLHLDGARLFIESAYTRRPVLEYTALFDTVYISMYKYFNAASGAILAGPKALLANLYHTRRMFGGGLYHVWPFAAVALHYIDGFEQRMHAAVENSERVLAGLGRDERFEVERVPNGTNIFRLGPKNVDLPAYVKRLDSAGISVPAAAGSSLTVLVNETWGRVPAEQIVERFRRALG